MTEGLWPAKEPQDHSPIDDFELHRRKWAAEDGILKAARKLERQHDLEAHLLEDLENASKEGDDDSYYLAMHRFLEALNEAMHH